MCCSGRENHEGLVLHRAGIGDGSAPGCLPNTLENWTFRGPPKGAFLPPAVLFGGFLPGVGCAEPNAGGTCSCLLSSLPNGYYGPWWNEAAELTLTDKSFLFILPCLGGVDRGHWSQRWASEEEIPTSPLTQAEARGTAEPAKRTIQVCPGPTANVGIRMVSQDTDERREKFRMFWWKTSQSLLIASKPRGFERGQRHWERKGHKWKKKKEMLVSTGAPFSTGWHVQGKWSVYSQRSAALQALDRL